MVVMNTFSEAMEKLGGHLWYRSDIIAHKGTQESTGDPVRNTGGTYFPSVKQENGRLRKQ